MLRPTDRLDLKPEVRGSERIELDQRISQQLPSGFADRRDLDDVETVDRALIGQVSDALVDELVWMRRNRQVRR